MPDPSLSSLAAYSSFLAEQVNRPSIQSSTLNVWSESPYTAVAEGEIVLAHTFRLRLREELDFDSGLIAAYGYEVYRESEKLYWYDDFPHPNDPALASTHPHHKHVTPDIKRNRIPAPSMSYSRPNLPQLILEIESLMEQLEAGETPHATADFP